MGACLLAEHSSCVLECTLLFLLMECTAFPMAEFLFEQFRAVSPISMCLKLSEIVETRSILGSLALSLFFFCQLG